MKQTLRLFVVALVAGVLTLVGYTKFVETDNVNFSAQPEIPSFIPTHFSSDINASMNIDFTEAAEKTVNAVVHVKNTTVSNKPTNAYEYFYGGKSRTMIGAGSGVIISADGYIITNNHVIANSSQLEVVLNNNKTYIAELIGTDPNTDIALLKIKAGEDLPFIAFGDSNDIKIGEWVLAVGNPFNLTSTVTAGIISAKARDLNEFDSNPQSFIQTDAAVNRGNSGGALVNIRGELVGINTAITSETGSFVGYSFAVPSNNALKVVQDIIEYGNVQRGILGIQGSNLNSKRATYLGIDETEGVYVAGIEKGSGADKGGILKGDIIKKLDGYKVGKFSDLTGYLGSKQPNDVVNVTVLRDGGERTIPVTLIRLETFRIEELGLEIKNAGSSDLRRFGIEKGVIVSDVFSRGMDRYKLEGIIITKINDYNISDINDVKRIMSRRDYDDSIKMTFIDQEGDTNSFIFR